MNPFEEKLTEEQIKHRKMWKKLTAEEKMNWCFNQLMFNIETGKWVERSEEE